MLTSTVRRSGSRIGRNAEPPKGWRSARSATRAGLGGTRRWDAAARLPPRLAVPALSAHPHRSRHPGPGRQSGQTCPRGRGRGAHRGHPRQHHHRRGLFDLYLGKIVGQEDCPVQPRHAGGCHQTPNAKPPAGRCLARAPDPPRCPSIAFAGRGCPKTSPSAPTCAHTAGCTVTVTSSPPPWRPASSLTDPDDPRTARVDYRLAHALRAWLASQQEWEGSVNRHQPPPSPD